jgi:hypothetical protein
VPQLTLAADLSDKLPAVDLDEPDRVAELHVVLHGCVRFLDGAGWSSSSRSMAAFVATWIAIFMSGGMQSATRPEICFIVRMCLMVAQAGATKQDRFVTRSKQANATRETQPLLVR